jgi:hypothetical protein
MTTKLGDWIQQQLPENRLHLLRHQPSYFAKGRDVQRLVAWLTDFGFLQQKLEAVGINPLIDDYDLAIPLVSETEQQTLSLIQGALRLSAHILDQDKTQLAGKCWGGYCRFLSLKLSRYWNRQNNGGENPGSVPSLPILPLPAGH